METTRLRYFTTIAESGSLTKAADLLGISHSGLSKAITALEAEAKLKLFRPQGRGLEITAEGKWFYQKAKEILKIADEIYLKEPVAKPPVRIGTSIIVAIYCAGALVEEIAQSLAIDEIDVGETEAKIIANEIDFGIAFTPSPKPELEYLELGNVHFNAYAHPELLKQGEDPAYVVPISEFPQNPLGYRNRDGWPNDLPRNAKYAVRSFGIAVDIARAGKAALYMPDFVVGIEAKRGCSFARVKQHAAAESVRKLYLVKRQAGEETREMKKAAKVIRRLCCGRAN